MTKTPKDMNKYREEELLKSLEFFYGFYKYHHSIKDKNTQEQHEQAYQQIKALIQKPGTIFNCPSCGRIWDSKTHDACQCGAIIGEKPGVTEAWIEEKAKELSEMTKHHDYGTGVIYFKDVSQCKDFIRSIVEKIPAKKATVSEEFVDRKSTELAELFRNPKRVELHKAIINTEFWVKQMLIEANVEVVKK